MDDRRSRQDSVVDEGTSTQHVSWIDFPEPSFGLKLATSIDMLVAWQSPSQVVASCSANAVKIFLAINSKQNGLNIVVLNSNPRHMNLTPLISSPHQRLMTSKPSWFPHNINDSRPLLLRSLQYSNICSKDGMKVMWAPRSYSLNLSIWLSCHAVLRSSHDAV